MKTLLWGMEGSGQPEAEPRLCPRVALMPPEDDAERKQEGICSQPVARRKTAAGYKSPQIIPTCCMDRASKKVDLRASQSLRSRSESSQV